MLRPMGIATELFGISEARILLKFGVIPGDPHRSQPSQLSIRRRNGFEKTETADRSQRFRDFLAQKDFSAVFHWFAMFFD